MSAKANGISLIKQNITWLLVDMVLSTHVQFNDSLFPYAHSSDMEFNGRRKTPYLRAP